MALTSTAYSPANAISRGGSSNLSFYWTAPQHLAWLNATGQNEDEAVSTGTAGWYRPLKNLSGGQIAHERDTEEIYNEAGNLLGNAVSNQRIVLTNGLQGVDSVTILTLEWMEEGGPFPARYPLPRKIDGTFETASDGDRTGTLFGFHETRVRPSNRTIPTNRDTDRVVEFEVAASLPEGGSRIYEVADVNIDDETAWPDRMAPFKNTPA